jgi:hypothetical protein
MTTKRAFFGLVFAAVIGTLGACGDVDCPVYSSYPTNGTACSVPKACHYGGCFCDDSSGTWFCPQTVRPPDMSASVCTTVSLVAPCPPCHAAATGSCSDPGLQCCYMGGSSCCRCQNGSWSCAGDMVTDAGPND